MLDAGATTTTIDATWIETCVAWLAANNLTSSLLYWIDPAFGTKKSGSVVQKVYCLGTTRLPRGGDFTPKTSNTTYSATGMNGTVPGWTNPNSTDHGYFGGGRVNNIRRKLQLTCVAAYKKPGTAQATLIGSNQFSGGFILKHVSGTPGSASFILRDDVQALTATKAATSATTANIIAGVFDGTNLTTYVEGVAGTPVTGLHANLDMALSTALKGTMGGTQVPVITSGSENSRYNYTLGTYTYSNNEALFTASDFIIFEKGLSDAQVASLTTLLRTRIGA